ncbi:Exopolysaccharide biosynthesis protein [Rhodovastum atsumiense]|nr:exopolysaccharide biosynthesis protein [Rhodovastum atsumiense]CAH2604502.1 Exopolysaccharide biosynthesis protein [Rhodovastum atsumiense]
MTAAITTPVSIRLATLGETLEGHEDATVGDIVDALGDAGLGLMLLLLALPAMIPIPGLPVGLVFGLAMVALGAQMASGAHRPWLPGRLRRRRLRGRMVTEAIRRSLPWVKRMEAWLRPGRLRDLTSGRVQAALGLPVAVLGLALAVPIPFGNNAPGLAAAVLACGLLVRDGGAVLAGLGLTVLSVLVVGALVVSGAHVFDAALALFV